MLDALYIAAIGLQAQKEQLDALAGNLANVGTTAYKRQSVDFAALLDRSPAAHDTDAAASGVNRPGRLLLIDQTPGPVHETGRALDIAIIGNGFVPVQLPGDKIGYTRAGALQINGDGSLAVLSGQALQADIVVPSDATALQVLPSGEVVALLPGETSPTVLGQIELATFANPELLQYHGTGIFTPPEGVEPQLSRPGEGGTNALTVGSLEGSNVKMTDEMVSLLLMQRIYELNSRVAQVADELIGMSNNMRRT